MIQIIRSNVHSQILLEEDAAVNATDVDGWTPLHYAARYGHSEIFEVCI